MPNQNKSTASKKTSSKVVQDATDPEVSDPQTESAPPTVPEVSDEQIDQKQSTDTEQEDSDSDSESDQDLDLENMVEQEDSDSDDDVIEKLVQDGKDLRAMRAIKGFNSLEKGKMHVLMHLTPEYDSAMGNGQKVRVMVVKKSKKDPVTFVYAPTSIDVSKAEGYLAQNGACIKPQGQEKSLTTKHFYHKCDLFHLSAKLPDFACSIKQACKYEQTIKRALKALAKERQETEKVTGDRFDALKKMRTELIRKKATKKSAK